MPITLKQKIVDYLNNLSIEEAKEFENSLIYNAFPKIKKGTVRKVVNEWRSTYDPTVTVTPPPEPKKPPKKRRNRSTRPSNQGTDIDSMKEKLIEEPADIEIEVSKPFQIDEINEENIKKQLLYVMNSKATLMKERIQCINLGISILDKKRELHQEKNQFNDIPDEDLGAILSVIPGMQESREEREMREMLENE